MPLGSRRFLACLVAIAALSGNAGCDKPAPTGAQPAPTSMFGGTDLAWIEISIAMDVEVVPLLDLASTRAADAGVRRLAADLETSAVGELVMLRQLHDAARLPARNPHEGMPMPGMVTADQVAAAGHATGHAFDALLLSDVTAHLNQGFRLATSETKAGVEPRTLALARRVLASRTAFLRRVAPLTRTTGAITASPSP